MIGNEWRPQTLKATVERIVLGLAALLICAGVSPAAELHPIVEFQSGYLFGATSNGKWIKADEAAKALPGETTYQVYGLTQAFGEAKGSKPKPSEEDVCSDVLTVSLSPKPEKGAIAIAAPWNALPDRNSTRLNSSHANISYAVFCLKKKK